MNKGILGTRRKYWQSGKGRCSWGAFGLRVDQVKKLGYLNQGYKDQRDQEKLSNINQL